MNFKHSTPCHWQVTCWELASPKCKIVCSHFHTQKNRQNGIFKSWLLRVCNTLYHSWGQMVKVMNLKVAWNFLPKETWVTNMKVVKGTCLKLQTKTDWLNSICECIHVNLPITEALKSSFKIRLPFASFSCCRSCSRFSFDTFVEIPRAPATNLLAATAVVSGRGLYGCRNSKITNEFTKVHC